MADPFVDVQFVSGTVISSAWLNGINDSVKDWITYEGLGPVSFNVDTRAALKALDGTKYTTVFVRGYNNVSDGGGGFFRTDPTDTTSADNMGTIAVGTDGTRWKYLNPDSYVNARIFGVIPGLPDVSANLNAALTAHLNNFALRLPWGIINTGTTIIDIPGGADVQGVGPVNSNYGPIISTAPHGTQIVSAVPNDYAVRIAYNTPVVLGGTNVGNFEVKNTAGHGLFCQSMGTGAIIHDIGVHDCLQKGAHFSYLQDSSLINLEVVNCGAGTHYGVTFDINCNACRVDKMLIVQCRQPLLIKDCTFFDLYAAHIEQGEYPSPPNNVVNCTFIGGGFQMQNCQHINWYGGLFVPNSSVYLAAQYSIAESATPFYFTTDTNCKNIKMFGPKFSSPEFGSRFVSANNLEMIGPTFNGAVSKVTSVEGTNVKIRDGQAELYDDQSQNNLLFGFFAGRSKITDFEIICSNPSSTNKVSGALLDGVADVGNYTVTVDKFFNHLGSTVSYKGSHGVGGVGYTQSTDTIDVRLQNAGEAIIINNSSSVLRNLANVHGSGNVYKIVNNTLGSITVQTAGNISTPAPITIPSFGSMSVKHIPGGTTLSPEI